MYREQSRIRAKSFGISRDELEKLLIREFDMPRDIVITSIQKSPDNQEGWSICIQSQEFEQVGPIDILTNEVLHFRGLGQEPSPMGQLMTLAEEQERNPNEVKVIDTHGRSVQLAVSDQ